ncbi:MAG: hypothetical protein ACRD1T_20830, partial [Acidimicrobiia bacterium]
MDQREELLSGRIMTSLRAHPWIALITFTYAVGFTVFGLTVASAAVVPYAILMVIAIALLTYLDRRTGFS